MAKFADFDAAPAAERSGDATLLGAVKVESAREEDLPHVASIRAERNGKSVAHHLRHLRRMSAELHRRREVYVARVDGHVAGYATAEWMEGGTLIPGWYLSGLVVSPAYRRHGIGTALTDHRMHALRQRTDSVYFFANSINRVIIELHESLGFKEVKRPVVVPKCSFEGGEGVLFRCELANYTGHG